MTAQSPRDGGEACARSPGSPLAAASVPFALLAGCFAAAGWAAYAWSGASSPPDQPVVAPIEAPVAVQLAEVHHQKTREYWETQVLPRCARAEAQCQEAAEASLADLQQWIVGRRAGSEPFAERMLSLRSKWLLARSYLSDRLTGEVGLHERFVRDAFAEFVFSEAELETAIQKAWRAYMDQTQAVENQLLVDLRLDVDDTWWARVYTLSMRTDGESAQPAATAHLPAVGGAVLGDTIVGVSTFAAGDAAMALGSAAAGRLGVSVGLLGAGAGASWASCGLSLGAAVVLDQLVSLVIEAIHDPQEQLQQRVDELIGGLAEGIIDGNERRPGLRHQWLYKNQARAAARVEALQPFFPIADQ